MQNGNAWQCVELAARLYFVRGWGVVYAGGNGGAKYIPEGSPGLTFYPNGAGYVPIPGDLIIHSTGTYGHVTVVDSVSGSTVVAAEQNSSTDGRHFYTLSGSTLSDGSAIRGVVHSPKNQAPSDSSKDMAFIKTRNTGSGMVEIHTATAASGYRWAGHSASWIGTSDQNNGWFQMVGRDLFFIKTRNTGSGMVEVHTATAASGYRWSDLHAASWIGTSDQNNGWFQMVGRDLFFIKTRNTGSGMVEVHTATAASGYRWSDLHAASWIGTSDQNNGWFQIQTK